MKHNIYLFDPETKTFSSLLAISTSRIVSASCITFILSSLFVISEICEHRPRRSLNHSAGFHIASALHSQWNLSQPLCQKSSPLWLILLRCWQRWCCCAIWLLYPSRTSSILLVRFCDKWTRSDWWTAVTLLLDEVQCVAPKGDEQTLGALVQEYVSLLAPLSLFS